MIKITVVYASEEDNFCGYFPFHMEINIQHEPRFNVDKDFFLFMLFLVFKYVIHSNLGKNVFEDVSFLCKEMKRI